MPDWTIESARKAYAIPRWAEGYFEVDAQGRLCVRPRVGNGPSLALQTAVEHARAAGLRLPLLLRFPEILAHRVQALRTAFASALEHRGLAPDYTPVYPIKVNQQRSVVVSLMEDAGCGLEVGSKPELLAALAISRPGGLVICNGYKDREYLRLALIGRLIGLDTVIVLEKPGELESLRAEAAALGVTPRLGVRLRLASLGSGNWQDTGGERAKFGLSTGQLLRLVDDLSAAGEAQWLSMLHFHMGSQIPNLRDIQHGVREAGRFLVELQTLGCAVQTVDIGGGLGVDYEGSGTRSFCSVNYGMQQYAAAVVNGLADLCRAHELAMPALVSESGRALTAHHAVLVAPLAAREVAPGGELPASADPDEPPAVRGMRAVLESIDDVPPEELWLDAGHYLEEARNLFLYGDLGLRERGLIEQLYYCALRRLESRLDPAKRRQRELRDQLTRQLADKYFVNFSVFQSLPDVWALDQVFPIVPLSGLDTAPDRHAVIEDLTCDSDGRIGRYVDGSGVAETLRVHSPPDAGEYLLGIFMVGAYQDTLGDIHNLFGRIDKVDVRLDGEEPALHHRVHGDTAADMLTEVGFDPAELLETCRGRVRAAINDPRLREHAERTVAAGHAGYTYLQVESKDSP